MQNHVIDPTWFYDAIEEFAFNFDWYVEIKRGLDDFGRENITYNKQVIRGSLQSQGTSLVQDNRGNTENMQYMFYCKSLYRINVGDFILYKNRWLHVDGVHDYDEYGVRNASLTMVNLNNYKDFEEYLKYLNGEKLV